MKTAIVLTMIVSVCLMFFFRPSLEMREASSVPLTLPVPLSQVGEPAEVHLDREVDETIGRVLDRLPEVEGMAKMVSRPERSTNYILTEGCTSRAMLRPLMAAPRENDLKCIWDAKDFNPRHVAVSESAREQCRVALQPFMDASAELRRVANRLAMNEFRQYVDQRSQGLPFVSLERYLAIMRERAPSLLRQATVGGEVVVNKVHFVPSLAFEFEAELFRFAGDGWFGARLADMRTARPAFEAMTFTGLELVRAVIEFALFFGTLSPEEAEQLRVAAVTQFEAMLR